MEQLEPTTLESRVRAMFAHKIAAIVRMSNAADAHAACTCLIESGFKLVELTLTTPDALDIIKTLAKTSPADVLIGAGTVMDAFQARAAIDSGAQFVVSAIAETGIIRPCREAGVVSIPGAMTPTEIVACWRLGANVIKVFPAGVIGGINFIKAIRGPLPEIPLWVSGFVPARDANTYLAAGVQLVGLTTELFPSETILAKDWSTLTEHMRACLATAQTSP